MSFGPKSSGGAIDLVNITAATVATTGNASVGGTLTVTGASALAALTATGRITAPAGIDAMMVLAASTALFTTAASGNLSGTCNTTAAVNTVYGVDAEANCTRSSGANALTNVGLYAAASGGQTNIAIQADQGGDVLLCGAADLLTIGGPSVFNTGISLKPERLASSGALSTSTTCSIVSGTASLMTLADGTRDGQIKLLMITSGTGTLIPAHMTTGTTLTWSAGKSGALLIWDATAGKWSVPLQVGCPIT